MQIDLILGVVSFTGVVLLLVLVIIFARSRLVSTGSVNIEINDDPANTITVPAGSKLLQTLAENKIFLSSACGGGGTCSQCKCLVMDGGGSILPTEESHFTSKEQNEGWRLSCSFILIVVAVIRELFGAGTLMGVEIFPLVSNGGWYPANNLLLLPPSSFIIIGLLIWVIRVFNKEQVEEKDFSLSKHDVSPNYEKREINV